MAEKEKVAGTLEVGALLGEVIVSHPELQTDSQGRGWIIFSPRQARAFARSLLARADEAEKQKRS